MTKFVDTNTHFKRLRVLAIVAIVLTLLLAIFMIVESSTDFSTLVSRSITNALKKPIVMDESLAPTKIKFGGETSHWFAFEDFELTTSVTPENANTKCIITITDENDVPLEGFDIDNDNMTIRCNDLIKRYVKVTVASAIDDRIFESKFLYTNGLNPLDERVKSREMRFFEDRACRKQLDTLQNLIIGKTYQYRFALIVKDEYLDELGLTTENNFVYTPTSLIRAYINGEKLPEHISFSDGMLIFYDDFDGDLTIKCTDGQNFLTEGAFYTTHITTTHEGSQNYIPSVIEPYIYNNVSSMDDMYTIEKTDEGYTLTILDDIKSFCLNGRRLDNEKTYAFRLEHSENSEEYCYFNLNIIVNRLRSCGEFDIYLVSTLAPTLREKIHVIFNGTKPNKITYSGDKTFMLNAFANIEFETQQDIAYQNDVIWTIVDGSENIGESKYSAGKLIGTKLGIVTLRAQSVYDENIYTEVTIDVKLFNNLYYFVRKVFGHMAMFALFGLGIYGICFLLIKPRWVTYIVTPISVFLMGGLCESLQYLNPAGRSFAFSDIVLDTVSGVVGMLVGAVVVMIVCLIWKKKNSESYSTLKDGFSHLKGNTLLKKSIRLDDNSNDIK